MEEVAATAPEQDQADSQAAFDATFEATPAANPEPAPAPKVEPKVEPVVVEEPLFAGMTAAEIRAMHATVSGFDARMEKERQSIFSKVGELHRKTLEDIKQATKGGGGKTRQITAEMLKRVNEELPGIGEALAADLNEALNSPDMAEAQAEAQSQGKAFDPDAYFAEKLGPILQNMQRQATEEQARLATEARQHAILDIRHDGWEETINTPEFRAWAHVGGPTETERTQLSQLQMADPARYAIAQNDLIQKYPQWWASRGHLINSSKAVDAIKLLDEFKSSGKPKPSGQRTRLEAAIPVKGTGGGESRQTETDAEAMRRAFDAQFE